MSKIIEDKLNKRIQCLDERFYLSDDGVTYFPSVTTVLEAYFRGYGFYQWLKDVGNNADEVMRRAGESGTRVHNAIDLILKGQSVEWRVENENLNYTLEEWQMLCKFMEFWERENPEVIAFEQNLVSDKHRIGGTTDLICRIKGEVWLIDYKTSNYIHKSHELQLSAYATMWNEKHEPIQRAGILWLKAATRGEDKKGKTIQGAGWQLKEFDRHYTDAFKIFQATQIIWVEENPNFRPKNLIYPMQLELKTNTNN